MVYNNVNIQLSSQISLYFKLPRGRATIYLEKKETTSVNSKADKG